MTKRLEDILSNAGFGIFVIVIGVLTFASFSYRSDNMDMTCQIIRENIDNPDFKTGEWERNTLLPKICGWKDLKPYTTANDDTDVATYSAEFKRIGHEMLNDAVANAEIPGFYKYYFTKIESTCPFYEPDGATYRECLLNLMENKKTQKSKSEINNADNFCNKVNAEYGSGLEAVELYLDCMIFELQ